MHVCVRVYACTFVAREHTQLAYQQHPLLQLCAHRCASSYPSKYAIATAYLLTYIHMLHIYKASKHVVAAGGGATKEKVFRAAGSKYNKS